MALPLLLTLTTYTTKLPGKNRGSLHRCARSVLPPQQNHLVSRLLFIFMAAVVSLSGRIRYAVDFYPAAIPPP